MIDSVTGQTKRRSGSVLLIGAAMLLLLACMPLSPPPSEGGGGVDPAAVTLTPSATSKVNVLQVEGRTVLDVTSETGIGSAVVTWTAQNADPIVLRLHLRGLEEFGFTYGSTEVLASVSSSSGHQVRQSVVTAGGAREAISPASPYWLTIEPKTSTGEPARSIPLEDGYFDVTSPDDFAQNPAAEFTFAWIDFYR